MQFTAALDEVQRANRPGLVGAFRIMLLECDAAEGLWTTKAGLNSNFNRVCILYSIIFNLSCSFCFIFGKHCLEIRG